MINWEVVVWTCITVAVILGIIGLILCIISASGMKRRRGEMQAIHTELGIGSQVMFGGGIYGRVVGFEDEGETVNVEIAKSTMIKISRYAIQAVVSGEAKEK